MSDRCTAGAVPCAVSMDRESPLSFRVPTVRKVRCVPSAWVRLTTKSSTRLQTPLHDFPGRQRHGDEDRRRRDRCRAAAPRAAVTRRNPHLLEHLRIARSSRQTAGSPARGVTRQARCGDDTPRPSLRRQRECSARVGPVRLLTVKAVEERRHVLHLGVGQL